MAPEWLRFNDLNQIIFACSWIIKHRGLDSQAELS